MWSPGSYSVTSGSFSAATPNPSASRMRRWACGSAASSALVNPTCLKSFPICWKTAWWMASRPFPILQIPGRLQTPQWLPTSRRLGLSPRTSFCLTSAPKQTPAPWLGRTPLPQCFCGCSMNTWAFVPPCPSWQTWNGL